SLREIANRIEARVGAKFAEAARVRISERAQVKLLGPSFLRVESAEKEHHIRGKLSVLLGRSALSAARFLEDGRRGLFRARVWVALIDAVIRQPAAVGMEKVMSPQNGLTKRSEIANVYIAGRRQFLDPSVELRRIIDRQCLVRTKSWVDTSGQSRC